jgi:hypothetical protein
MAGKTFMHFKVFDEAGNAVYTPQQANNNYEFLLDPTQLGNGPHEYDIELKLSSGSGSIAEDFGLEYYLVQRTIVVTVDNSTPAAISNLTASMINGYMTLQWEKPAHEHFYYRIIKFDADGKFLSSLDVKNEGQASFVDEGYVGGKVTYVVTLTSSFFDVPSEPVSYELQPIEVESSIDGGNYLKLKWNVLTAFDDDVVIRVSGRNFSQDFPWASSEAYVDTLYLGDMATATVKVLRNDLVNDGYSIANNHHIGKKINPFYQYSFLESSNDLIFTPGNGSTKTYRYNATSFEVEDSVYHGIASPLISSEDGTRQYFVLGAYGYMFNPLDLSVPISQIYFNSIFWPLYHRDLVYPVPYGVSNDNLFVLGNQEYRGGLKPTIVTMDLTTKQLWGSEKEGNVAALSGNGDFMVITNAGSGEDGIVYKRGASDWEMIGKVPYGKMFFSRDPGTTLVQSNNGTTHVYDLTSTPDGNGHFSSVVSAQIDATAFDRITNRVIQESIDAKMISTITTYSLDNLELVSTLKARVTGYYQHFIAGNKQMVSTGYIKNVE